MVLDNHTKEKAGMRGYRLLLVDGHSSHVSLDFLDYADRNRIIVLVLSPHATHRLQPLGVGLFSPLSKAYSLEVSNYFASRQKALYPCLNDCFIRFSKMHGRHHLRRVILRLHGRQRGYGHIIRHENLRVHL